MSPTIHVLPPRSAHSLALARAVYETNTLKTTTNGHKRPTKHYVDREEVPRPSTYVATRTRTIHCRVQHDEAELESTPTEPMSEMEETKESVSPSKHVTMPSHRHVTPTHTLLMPLTYSNRTLIGNWQENRSHHQPQSNNTHPTSVHASPLWQQQQTARTTHQQDYQWLSSSSTAASGSDTLWKSPLHQTGPFIEPGKVHPTFISKEVKQRQTLL